MEVGEQDEGSVRASWDSAIVQTDWKLVDVTLCTSFSHLLTKGLWNEPKVQVIVTCRNSVFRCLYYRDQCEELRAILTRRYGDEVCRDRAEQLRLKDEKRKREQESMFTVLFSPL